MTTTPLRKLAAIMFTDIAGFTALSAKDEEKALKLIKRQRELVKPIVEKFGGSWLKEIGDGLLLVFPSSKQALSCAIEIQHTVKQIEDLNLRIGIHQGDILEEDGDIFGDDVNIASRIEPFAAVGGIAISHKIYGDISGSPEFQVKYIGQPKLKGVIQEVKIYCLTSHDLPSTNLSEVEAKLEKRDGPRLGSQSIAVLPFANWSELPENEYFSDGITDDILTQLTKIKDLKVISRTSIMQYKRTEKTIRDIGKELGVATVLEGSVRRNLERVRITGQLVDTRTDEHLWAETYDRDLVDIFAIQMDVAENIASALKTILSPEDKQRIKQQLTESTEAYDYYLKAIEFEHMGEERKNRQIAINLFKKAVAIDSSFAQAIAHISLNHSRLYYIEKDKQHLDLAKEAIDKAEQLQTNDTMVHMAKGQYLYYGFLDYARAIDEFYFAQRLEPGNGVHAQNIGAIQRRLGNFEQALSNFMIAFEHDPRSSHIAWEIAGTYEFLRNYDMAEQFYDTSIGLADQSHSNAHFSKALLMIYRSGTTERSKKLIMRHNDTDNFFWMSFVLDVEEGNYKDALDRLSDSSKKIRRGSEELVPKEAYIGWIFELMGEPEKAQSHFKNALTILKDEQRNNSNDPRIHAALGWVYAHFGCVDEAIQEGRKAVDLMPISIDALIGPIFVENLAQIYIIVGQYDEGLDLLEYLLEIPCLTSVGSLRFHRVWDPLQDNPRFMKLLEKDEI